MEIIKVDKLTKEDEKKEILNVAAYARVSTGSEDQLNSFESQKKYYENKINQNENWILVDIYADEGISGTSLHRRENFLKMIKDAMSGKIDLILTKSISRFARNTVDTLKYVRLLKERNISIIFEEENINTLDKSGEFLLTVLSSVAQQESENISTHVKKGHEMLLKDGNLILGNGCFGYRFINKEKRLEIIPEEAKIVRKMYKMFLDGKNFSEIKRILESQGVKTYTKRSNWDTTSIKYILTNEKYVGDLLQKKMVKVNPFERRRKNNGLSEKYFIRNHHKPIVSRELFEKVQERLVELDNNNKYKHTCHNITALSYKIKCGYCFYSYNNSRRKKTGYFMVCRNRRENGRSACPESMDMHQIKIYNIVKNGLRKAGSIIANSEDKDLKYVKKIINDSNSSFDDETIGKIVKFVFVGGYDYYGRAMPFMIRIVLFNSFPTSEYSIKKLSIDEIKKTKTKQIYEGWISQRIIKYGPKGPTYHREEISKVKCKVEIEQI